MRDDLNSLLDWNVAEHGGLSGGGRRVIVGSQAVNRTTWCSLSIHLLTGSQSFYWAASTYVKGPLIP